MSTAVISVSIFAHTDDLACALHVMLCALSVAYSSLTVPPLPPLLVDLEFTVQWRQT